jgi:multidrug efflux system membrane fusion protein
LMVHQGDLIRANDATPLVVINQVSPVRVVFSVPGRFLADVRRFQRQKPLRVEVRTPAALLPGQQAPLTRTPAVDPGTPASVGTVTFIDNAVDATTGTIKLKGTFANSDHRLWPGLFVQVKLLLTTQPEAVVVPSAAIQSGQNGQGVYVVKADQTVDYREVTVERQHGDDVIVASGLRPGETVVTDGQLRLTPGVHVTTRPPETGGRAGGSGPRPNITP